MFVEGTVESYTHDIKDSDTARRAGKQVRAALLGLDEVADSASPPSDEVINAQARGEVEAPHSHRRFKDPAAAK